MTVDHAGATRSQKFMVCSQERMHFDKLHNYGKGGASNEDTYMQLLDYIQIIGPTNDVTAIVHPIIT